jgi:hypothetical protein
MTGSAARRNAEFSTPSDERTLTWSDLALVAKVHAVECVSDDTSATLRFARTKPIPANRG